MLLVVMFEWFGVMFYFQCECSCKLVLEQFGSCWMLDSLFFYLEVDMIIMQVIIGVLLLVEVIFFGLVEVFCFDFFGLYQILENCLV